MNPRQCTTSKCPLVDVSLHLLSYQGWVRLIWKLKGLNINRTSFNVTSSKIFHCTSWHSGQLEIIYLTICRDICKSGSGFWCLPHMAIHYFQFHFVSSNTLPMRYTETLWKVKRTIFWFALSCPRHTFFASGIIAACTIANPLITFTIGPYMRSVHCMVWEALSNDAVLMRKLMR